MKWLELATTVDLEAVESVAEVFARYGHNGGVSVEEPVTLSDDGLSHTVDPTGQAVIKTYLSVDEQTEDKRRRVEEALWHLGQMRPVGPLQVTERDEEEWADAWKKYFHPSRIGSRVVIKPSWHDYKPEPNDVVIELDPGMAFGTGLHPTTQMCLRALEEVPMGPGTRALDLGTGSGILAIAAAKLGAGHVAALDVDPVAVRVARENVERNAALDRIHVQEGSIDAVLAAPEGPIRGPFDLIVANIIAQVLIDLAPRLRQAMKPDGTLVASGIIDERAEEVSTAFLAAGMSIVKQEVQGDWVALFATPAR